MLSKYIHDYKEFSHFYNDRRIFKNYSLKKFFSFTIDANVCNVCLYIPVYDLPL